METSRIRDRPVVILDTSVMMYAIQERVDLLEGIKEMLGNVDFLVTEEVVKEISELSRGRGKKGELARVSEKVYLSKIDAVSTGEKSADLSILSLSENISRERRVFVATADMKLKKELRNRGISVIFPRNRKKLELDPQIPIG